ncbi:MAG: hypothetical protein A2W93_14370 [Bacteroidetes bacterium GWF2_43_63]|nr:MAG: hypothetical protein A2W94_00940 [Bacteroidetes bacterium GWE2_42_42]OFY52526.1 MAG: hypothetical protein A2W93_14370 [Bacteroidetes bacterium GWF2_43_63]HBG71433.1 hypothetical protein [Bacteroidales bacterium]HCB60815.1 hypothetical protein [Bacteroidales bacterium]HCY23460.1 hypothetical protein [Bacteroidales bacterium]
MKKITNKIFDRLKNWVTTLIGIAIICVAHYAYWFIGVAQIDWVGLTGITLLGIIIMNMKDDWLKMIIQALIDKFNPKP